MLRWFILGCCVGLFSALSVSCGTSSPCSPQLCPSGCCDQNGLCQAGTAELMCGTAGVACAACSVGEACQLGRCVTAGSGGGGGTAAGGGTATGGGTGTGGGSATTDAGCPTCTELIITLGSTSAPLDRAQHGVEADGGLYVEAHFGGDPACPTSSSPTPNRTLIISGLVAKPDGGVVTYQEGLRLTLLDFQGTLTSAPFVKAVAGTATPESVTPGTNVTFTIDAQFDGGTVRGRFSAPHCASLDG